MLDSKSNVAQNSKCQSGLNEIGGKLGKQMA